MSATPYPAIMNSTDCGRPFTGASPTRANRVVVDRHAACGAIAGATRTWCMHVQSDGHSRSEVMVQRTRPNRRCSWTDGLCCDRHQVHHIGTKIWDRSWRTDREGQHVKRTSWRASMTAITRHN